MQKKKKLSILNLYSGLGGNRKLWEGHDIIAVEWDKDIAKIYSDFFPKDQIIVTDAHQYLLDHYKEYDFIWSSPPCPTHSEIRRCGVYRGQYPDMKLTRDHVIPLTKKGTNFITNIQPLCRSCNSSKGNRIL